MQVPHSKSVLAALVVLCASLVLVGGASGAAVAPVNLHTATPFAVLASTGISGSPAASINGDLGLPAGAGITGVTCADVNGTIYTSDGAGPSCPPKTKTNAAHVGGALTSEGDALTNAQNRAGATPVGPALDGLNLGPGVYSFGAVASNLAGTLTLTGSASSVWIFQASTTLITGLGSTIQLAGGAQACNVFWAVGTQATLGGTFVGTVLSGTAIVMGLGSTVSGRLLAGSAVTLSNASVTVPTCTAAGGGGGSSSGGGGGGGPAPSRALYCDPVTGQTYNLVVGQDKQPPYAQLNLIPAYVDPVTGAQSCTFPAAATTTTATTTTATTTTATTTTSTTTAPTPVTPAPKPVVKKAPVAKAHKVVAPKHHAVLAAHVTPRRAKHTFGLTG